MARFEDVFSTEKRTSIEKHPKVPLKWIHYEKIVRSSYQFYSEKEDDVLALADLIEVDGGVLQNIVVRQIDADQYELIAGHKRTLACKYLVEVRGLTKYAFLPAFVMGCNDAVAHFRLMSTNVRPEKTQYEIMKEIEEMRYLLEHHADELGIKDEDLRGRMVERIGRQLNMRRSKVSDYTTISNNLGEDGKKAFKDRVLNKSAALALASLDEEDQKKLINEGVTQQKDILQYKEAAVGGKKKDIPKDAIDDAEVRESSTEIYTDEGTGTEAQGKESYDMSTKDTSDLQVAEQQGAEIVVCDVKTEHEELLRNYKNWNVWTENSVVEETFYRYDLPDKSAIVIRHYPYCRDGEQCEGVQYYLLKPGYIHFKDCETDVTTLTEHMKTIEKE